MLGIIFIAMMFFLKMWFSAYFLAHTNGNTYLENMIFYSPQELYKLLSAYGVAGRGFYVRCSIILDFAVPLLYSSFFTVCMVWIIKKSTAKKMWITIMLLLGILLCLSDWIENIFLIIIINHYPEQLVIMTYLACASTILKTVLTNLFFILIVVGFAFLLLKYIFHKKMKRSCEK